VVSHLMRHCCPRVRYMRASTCLPATTWFLYSEEDVPLGRVYRSGVPQVDVQIEESPAFAVAQVVSFTELRATCAMRRFKVVVRVLS